WSATAPSASATGRPTTRCWSRPRSRGCRPRWSTSCGWAAGWCSRSARAGRPRWSRSSGPRRDWSSGSTSCRPGSSACTDGTATGDLGTVDPGGPGRPVGTLGAMTVEHRDGHPERPGHAGDVAWHALPAAEVAARLGTGDRGLTAAEVAARQRTYGPNRLEEEPPPSVVALLFRQVRSPLIYILLVALAVTLLLGEFLDASVIAVALGLNTAI